MSEQMGSEQTDTLLPPIFVCDRCEKIGAGASAAIHELTTGHVSREVSADEAAGVREIWAAEGRSLIDGSGRA